MMTLIIINLAISGATLYILLRFIKTRNNTKEVKTTKTNNTTDTGITIHSDKFDAEHNDDIEDQ